MSPTEEQITAVERLQENEALIDNLIDDIAQVLLKWGEEKILSGVDADAVYAAIREVNQEDPASPEIALQMVAQAFAPSESAVVAAPPETQATPNIEAPDRVRTNDTPTPEQPVSAATTAISTAADESQNPPTSTVPETATEIEIPIRRVRTWWTRVRRRLTFGRRR